MATHISKPTVLRTKCFYPRERSDLSSLGEVSDNSSLCSSPAGVGIGLAVSSAVALVGTLSGTNSSTVRAVSSIGGTGLMTSVASSVAT